MNQLLNQDAGRFPDPIEAKNKVMQMLASGQISKEELREKWDEAERVARTLGLM